MTKRSVGIDKFHHESTTIEMEPHLPVRDAANGIASNEISMEIPEKR